MVKLYLFSSPTVTAKRDSLYVNTKFIWVTAGASGELFAVDNSNRVWRREGITSTLPYGDKWTQVNLSSWMFVEVFGGQMWGISSKRFVIDPYPENFANFTGTLIVEACFSKSF